MKPRLLELAACEGGATLGYLPIGHRGQHTTQTATGGTVSWWEAEGVRAVNRSGS